MAPNDDGTIAHAQLSFGNGMIMLWSVLNDETEFGLLVKQPDEIGGGSTQSAYVVVTDADAVYASAKAAGARIAMQIRDEDSAVAALAATTWKGACGALAPMTRGER